MFFGNIVFYTIGGETGVLGVALSYAHVAYMEVCTLLEETAVSYVRPN